MKTHELNRTIWAQLGLKVIERSTLARDGVTWLSCYVRALDGFCDPPPNFVHDLNITVAYLPLTVQFHLRWSDYEDQWGCVLSERDTGEFLAEAFGATPAEAAARAFYLMLKRQVVLA